MMQIYTIIRDRSNRQTCQAKKRLRLSRRRFDLDACWVSRRGIRLEAVNSYIYGLTVPNKPFPRDNDAAAADIDADRVLRKVLTVGGE